MGAAVLAAARDNPDLNRPRLDYEPNAPRLLVDIDRERAASSASSTTEIGRVLETMFGSRRATTYVRGGRMYDVCCRPASSSAARSTT